MEIRDERWIPWCGMRGRQSCRGIQLSWSGHMHMTDRCVDRRRIRLARLEVRNLKGPRGRTLAGKLQCRLIQDFACFFHKPWILAGQRRVRTSTAPPAPHASNKHTLCSQKLAVRTYRLRLQWVHQYHLTIAFDFLFSAQKASPTRHRTLICTMRCIAYVQRCGGHGRCRFVIM